MSQRTHFNLAVQKPVSDRIREIAEQAGGITQNAVIARLLEAFEALPLDKQIALFAPKFRERKSPRAP